MKRKLLIVFLNLVAATAPAFGLAVVFGAETAVDPNSAKHLIGLIAAGAFSAIVGFSAARLAARNDMSFMDVLEIRFGEPPRERSS